MACRRDLGARQSQNISNRDETQHECRQQQGGKGGIATNGGGDNLPAHTEEVAGHEAEHEGRSCDNQQGHHQNGGVEEAALAHTGNNAEADTENGLNGNGHQSQANCNREGQRDFLADRATGEGLAHIQGEQALEVLPVLDEERLIQVVVGAQCCDLLRWQLLIASQCSDGVAWHGEDHCINQQCGTEEYRHHLQESLSDIPTHGASPSQSSGSPRCRPTSLRHCAASGSTPPKHWGTTAESLAGPPSAQTEP